MKRILYYGLMTVIALAVFSCTDEETISISDNGVNVTGSFSSGTARTAYTVGESSVSVTWEAGDQIGIISASDNTVYQYTAATSGSTTDFEPVDSKIENIDGETFYAWYPNNGNSSSNILLPNIYDQTYSEDGISPEYDFIYSKGEINNNELNLSFSHLFAFLKITIDPEYLDFMGLYISSSDDIAIRSDSYYNFSNDSIVATFSKSLYYHISDEYLEGEDMITCYVAILPTSSSSDITIYNIHWLSSSSSVKIGDAIIQKISPANGFQAGHVYATTISENEVEEAKELERESLIALYQATDGDNWTNNENWCTDADISEWYGVTVYSTGLVKSISLKNNGLSGEIPAEIGNLTQLTTLNLGSNDLSGEIPKEIGNLTQLTWLSISNNELSGEIPAEIGNLTQLYYLAISYNELSGEIPAEIGNLTQLINLYLQSNELSGEIPAEIGNLTKLTLINLYENELSGEIPTEIGNLTQLGYLNLYNNELSGEIPTEIGNLTQLTGLNLKGNDLTGNIPVSLANLSALEEIDLTMNRLSGVIPDEIVNCDWWNTVSYDDIIYQQEGYGLTLSNMYESTDYSQDGEVYTLQEHTKGNGIKFVILGEAYSDRLIADGTYKTHVDWAYNALFSEEPFTTFKDYFDVYYVNVVSANEILGENTAFGVYYHSSNEASTNSTAVVSTNSNLVLDTVSKLKETRYSYEDVVSIVLINTSLSLRSICTISNSYAVAYCIAWTEENLEKLIHHEALGHGFGKLADEYIEYYATYPGDITSSHSNNMYMNVDTNDDPDEVLWSYFLSDSRYDNEELGIFEGAAYYAYGIYRPRYTSIMRGNTGGFNAPSRQEIYRRIMELSGEGYTFENFLEYDEVNRNSFVTGSAKLRNVEPEFTGVLGAPPIIIEDD